MSLYLSLYNTVLVNITDICMLRTTVDHISIIEHSFENQEENNLLYIPRFLPFLLLFLYC